MILDQILYDDIGIGYNETRRADPYLTDRLFQLLAPQPGCSYLDIGCGTGNYTIALASKGINFYGVEPSAKMLDAARSKNSDVTWVSGTAEQIRAADHFFDGAMATLTIHHWTDLLKAFTEIARVLKDGAKLLIFTAAPEQMQGYWLNYYFPKMLNNSILQMPALHQIETALKEAGFQITNQEKYFIKHDLQDCFLYAGKHRPEIYLDEAVRKGISSFSALANAEEVADGLQRLQEDLSQNRFSEVKEKFDNDLGDYLFISAQKCQQAT